MGRNVTFNLDDDLLKAARLYALEADTTLSDIVRDHLVALTWSDEKKSDWNQRFRALRKRSQMRFPDGFLSKEEMHGPSDVEGAGPDGHEHPPLRRHG
ncbi:MAG: hypothetical protein WBF53_15910 [Litorimonas sp.]